jgi:hypothetical protein
MNAQPPSAGDPAELPEPPHEAGGRALPAVGERPSSVKAAAPTVTSHDEDLPFPLPADWYERKHAAATAKAAADAAAKAAAEAAAKAAAEAATAAGASGAAVVRQRPSAEMLRAVAAASSGEDRGKAFLANLRKGDEASARGDFQEAASAYEVAARKAATPEQAAEVAAKAVAARSAAGRPRRLLTAALIAAALCGVGAGGWWLAVRRPAEMAAAGPPPPPPAHLLSDDKGVTTGNLNERAKANAALYNLASEVKDGERPWSAMLIAAKSALALPGVNHDEAQALVARIEGEVALLDKDAAAIEALRLSDPAKALALAEAFRSGRKRAGDYIARLPLPGRLLLVDCPPNCTVTLDGAAVDITVAASATGLLFCRSAQRALTAEASAPGYVASSVVIPAESVLIERRSQITMEEQPLWSMAAPASVPASIALASAGGVALMATPQLLQVVSAADGAPAPATRMFHAGGVIPGLAERAWSWTNLLAGTPEGFLMATSNGALCRVALGANGLHAELVARHERPMATLAMVDLVLRLNAKALFTGSRPWEPKAAAFGTPKEEVAKMLGQCEVRLTCDGKSLWSMALEGNLPPAVFPRGEQLLAIDDRAVHVLDQEGKLLRDIPLPSQRRAPVLSLNGGALLIVPTATAMMVYHDEGGGAYQAAPLGAGVKLVASDGDDLAVLSDQALQFLQAAGGMLSERWSLPLTGDTAPEQLSIHGGVICFYDSGRRLLRLFSAADHRELHRLRLNDGVMCTPLFLPDRVLVADQRGCLRAFPLVSPIPLGDAR